jgi:hypothetical protein
MLVVYPFETVKVSNITHPKLTLILLTWRIWRAPNNGSKWQMGFNLAFKGLKPNPFIGQRGGQIK